MNSGKGSQVFEKVYLPEGGSQKKKGKAPQDTSCVTREFIKKYISFAKAQKAPELTEEFIEFASGFYQAIRRKAADYDQSKVSVPVTVRTLETMIRLATAHAKLRLNKKVDIRGKSPYLFK